MSLRREKPDNNSQFADRKFIPGGTYLATLLDILETNDKGERFTKTFTPKGKEPVTRDALVLLFALDDVKEGPTECDDVLGEQVGKKVTDSLNEKAELFKIWRALMGADVTFPCDLGDLKGKKGLLVIDNGEKYGQDGSVIHTSFVKEVIRYIPERPRRGGSVDAQAVEQMAVAAGGMDDGVLPF